MAHNSGRAVDYFDRRASSFDALYKDSERLHYAFNRVVRRGLYERVELALAEMNGAHGFSVLDVGCGSGRNAMLFAEAGAGRVVGIDAAENMLRMARELAAQHPAGRRCGFVAGDFMAEDLKSSFDYVVALGVFDYVADPGAWLRRMVSQAKRKVITSFPQVSLVRAPLRRLRYALAGCRVYFYTRARVESLARDTGCEYRIVPYSSRGLLLVLTVGA